MAQRCFIQIKDGQPLNHPIVEANFRMAFPKINVDDLPPGFAEFVRIPRPEPDEGKYIVSSSVSYQWDGNVVKDVWTIEQADLPTGNVDVAGNAEG